MFAIYGAREFRVLYICISINYGIISLEMRKRLPEMRDSDGFKFISPNDWIFLHIKWRETHSRTLVRRPDLRTFTKFAPFLLRSCDFCHLHDNRQTQPVNYVGQMGLNNTMIAHEIGVKPLDGQNPI